MHAGVCTCHYHRSFSRRCACGLIESQMYAGRRGGVPGLEHDDEIGSTEEVFLGVELFLAIHLLNDRCSCFAITHSCRQTPDEGVAHFFVFTTWVNSSLRVAPEQINPELTVTSVVGERVLPIDLLRSALSRSRIPISARKLFMLMKLSTGAGWMSEISASNPVSPTHEPATRRARTIASRLGARRWIQRTERIENAFYDATLRCSRVGFIRSG